MTTASQALNEIIGIGLSLGSIEKESTLVIVDCQNTYRYGVMH